MKIRLLYEHMPQYRQIGLFKQTFYDEKEARDLIFTVLSAIKYLHDRKVVHR